MHISKLRTDKRIILGLDPGYADLGFAVIVSDRDPHYVICDTISTDKKFPMPERLLQIEKRLEALMTEHKPDIVAVEKLFFVKNVKTAIDVAHARGVILLVAARHHAQLVEYTPLEVKQSLTSYGAAPKQQVAQMTKTILHLDSLPKKDDATDALAIAVCAHFHAKFLP